MVTHKDELFIQANIYCDDSSEKNLSNIANGSLLSNIRCSPDDITDLAYSLQPRVVSELFATRAGRFIGYSILHCLDPTNEVIHIPTKGMENPYGCLGCDNNDKIIYVDGNAGQYSGQGMESGFLYIEGDAGKLLGNHMGGGVIDVGGKSPSHLGSHIKGGAIYLSSESKHIGGSRTGGDLYADGRLIVKDGHRVSS
ncbi:MAG: hypothetical protein ACI83O_000348 [Patescibacteria group bacterium]|jgi:hypothetical protein